MPQGNRGQRSTGRPEKRSSGTAASKVTAKSAKSLSTKPVAKPAAKRKAAEGKTASAPIRKVSKTAPASAPTRKAAASPTPTRKAASASAKPAAKASKPAKPTPRRKSTTPESPVWVAPQIEEQPQEPFFTFESNERQPVDEPSAEQYSSIWTKEANPEPSHDAWTQAATPEGFAGESITWTPETTQAVTADPPHQAFPETHAPDVPKHVSEPIVAQPEDRAATEEQPSAADSLFKPFVERRNTIRSLLERRLADPSAKERRATDSLAKEYAAASAANAPSVAAAAKERKAKLAAAAKSGASPATPSPEPISGVDPEASPFFDRRVGDRRVSAKSVESEMRSHEQQNLFNETAVWMRKGGTALIGLNVLVVIAVLFLWHRYSPQTPDMGAMQKATSEQMAELRRATTASEVAAYASCLGSQTARNMLLQMKTAGTTPRSLAPGNGSQANAAARAQAAQIEFDLEKSTSVNVHVPVLFHVGIANIGKSSALNTRVWGAVKVVDSGKEPDFRYGEVALTKEAISPTDAASKLVLYSADDAGLVTPLNDATIERVNSGAAYIVAYGRVVYQDIFGVRHWAEFCHDITEPTGSRGHFNRCAAYNSTGASEVADTFVAAEKAPQSSPVSLPEIACVMPKEQKN